MDLFQTLGVILTVNTTQVALNRALVSADSLLEKRVMVTPAIHFWYGLITVADTKNELLFFVSADLINRYKNTIFHIG
jgi:hypothetical protein